MNTNNRTTSADTDFYQENGYIRYEHFFSDQEVTSLRQAVDHAIDTHRARIKGAANDGRTSDEYERVFNQMVHDYGWRGSNQTGGRLRGVVAHSNRRQGHVVGSLCDRM